MLTPPHYAAVVRVRVRICSDSNLDQPCLAYLLKKSGIPRLVHSCSQHEPLQMSLPIMTWRSPHIGMGAVLGASGVSWSQNELVLAGVYVAAEF